LFFFFFFGNMYFFFFFVFWNIGYIFIANRNLKRFFFFFFFFFCRGLNSDKVGLTCLLLHCFAVWVAFSWNVAVAMLYNVMIPKCSLHRVLKCDVTKKINLRNYGIWHHFRIECP